MKVTVTIEDNGVEIPVLDLNSVVVDKEERPELWYMAVPAKSDEYVLALREGHDGRPYLDTSCFAYDVEEAKEVARRLACNIDMPDPILQFVRVKLEIVGVTAV